MINYFNFKPFNGQFLLTNDMGRYAFLNREHFEEFLRTKDVSDQKIRQNLEQAAFLYDISTMAFTSETRHQMMLAKSYLYSATQLHIFVVTTACNLQCVYCQAQNGRVIPNGFMSKEVAQKAVDIALQSPAMNLQFEFQGGEPLLNFEVIKFIVLYSQKHACEKKISYSIVSNLTQLTDDILDFIEEYGICLSTSIDGPEELHNLNRPRKDGKGSYCTVMEKLDSVRNRDIQIGALLTASKNTLRYPEAVVDTYVKSGFNAISLRALTPLGCANRKWQTIGYTPEEFLSFYKKSFEHILQLNRDGNFIIESMAAIFLQKILRGQGVNYMELRSPCGAAIGQIAYYHDGTIYTCDEGRMVAEMGNSSFRLGNIDNTYDELMDSKVCRAACTASILEGLPSCSDCVYQPYCGVCPAVNYALYGDLYEKAPNNYRCKVYKGMLDIIFGKLQKQDETIDAIFRRWIS